MKLIIIIILLFTVNIPYNVRACTNPMITSLLGKKICGAIESRNPYLLSYLYSKLDSNSIPETEWIHLLEQSKNPTLPPCFFKGILSYIYSHNKMRSQGEQYFYLPKPFSHETLPESSHVDSFTLKTPAVEYLLKSQGIDSNLYEFSQTLPKNGNSISDSFRRVAPVVKSIEALIQSDWSGKKGIFMNTGAHWSFIAVENKDNHCKIIVTDAAQHESADSLHMALGMSHTLKSRNCEIIYANSDIQKQHDPFTCSMFALNDFRFFIDTHGDFDSKIMTRCPDKVIFDYRFLELSQATKAIESYMLMANNEKKGKLKELLAKTLVELPQCDSQCETHFLDQLRLEASATHMSKTNEEYANIYGDMCEMKTSGKRFYPKQPSKPINAGAWIDYSKSMIDILRHLLH